MATKLLICDNTAALGRVIARKFMNMGIPSDCCRDSLSVMEKASKAADTMVSYYSHSAPMKSCLAS